MGAICEGVQLFAEFVEGAGGFGRGGVPVMGSGDLESGVEVEEGVVDEGGVIAGIFFATADDAEEEECGGGFFRDDLHEKCSLGGGRGEGGEDLGEVDAVEGGEGECGSGEVEVGGDGARYDDAAHSRGGGCAEAVEGIFEDEGLVGGDTEGVGGGEEVGGIGLGAGDVVEGADGVEAVGDTEAVEPRENPRGGGTGGDGAWEAGVFGVLEDGFDAWEDGGGIAEPAGDIGALLVEGVPIEGGAAEAIEFYGGVVLVEVAPDASGPDVEGEGVAVFGVEEAPGFEDGGFGIDDEAVEVEDEGADGRVWHGVRR